MHKQYKFEEYSHKNELGILRYMNARLKQNNRLRASNSEPNQLNDQLEFLSLIDELEHQEQLDRSATKAIEKYTKAIPIYL